jgi:catechol 2,3-dioxygenase-like lactoylglutathione lyase family enzyme
MSSSPILNEVGTVFIPVSSIDAAKEWYSELLGLPSSGEILFGHLYILPMKGSTGLVLDSNMYSAHAVFHEPTFHFHADDVFEAYAFLESKGVQLLTGVEHDHWFTFKDPDGNVLMICQKTKNPDEPASAE